MYKQNVNGNCRPESIVSGRNYRFTLLTPQLIRMEYSDSGVFEDRPTQIVLNRDFPTPKFDVWRTEGRIEIKTEKLNIFYDEKAFSPNGLILENHSDCYGIYRTWHYGDPPKENLGGTARTLDEADGPISLEPGLMSRMQGYSILDDSKSLILTSDGWVKVRSEDAIDLYFFGYGYNYKECLKDFFRLCGGTPLLPRYAFGNWWSRFYPYSDSQYEALMDKFLDHQIPLSVAVIDMDWHITHVDSNIGNGWTGYTWDKELFPDPKRFLDALHQRALKVTLNLHPAEGIQAHEEMYEQAALALGKDASRKQRIPFDVGDRSFLNVYFKYLHHPHEKQGVDFWWIDWQQGTTSSMQGLDPLWLLNHYHFLDIARNGKRPLILSRYAGPGSHRYPVGFSGDSVISWDSLRFQPYFTATASNIGYGWWSHDIGGHAHGKRDNELQVRWLQFGVFSPIMRMHSTYNRFNSKEPWRYPTHICTIMAEYLRLRHQLIPYLYTMNYQNHTCGKMLMQPMYYNYPQYADAYKVPNQYFFGSELIIRPITDPMNRALQRSSADVWLPDGLYFDVMSGLSYRGNRTIKMFRALERIPVLAKSGAIIPLASREDACVNGTALPKHLEIYVYAGANGHFELYEDDGETLEFEQGKYMTTSITFQWDRGVSSFLSIVPLPSNHFTPPVRTYSIHFVGVEYNSSAVVVQEKSQEEIPTTISYDKSKHELVAHLNELPVGETICLEFKEKLRLASNDILSHIEIVLNDAQIEYELKDQVYNTIAQGQNLNAILSTLQTMSLPFCLLEEISEILLA